MGHDTSAKTDCDDVDPSSQVQYRVGHGIRYQVVIIMVLMVLIMSYIIGPLKMRKAPFKTATRCLNLASEGISATSCWPTIDPTLSQFQCKATCGNCRYLREYC